MRKQYKIMKRYDYRREYKNLTKEQLKNALDRNLKRLIEYLGNGWDADYYFKRVCYIESLLKK